VPKSRVLVFNGNGSGEEIGENGDFAPNLERRIVGGGGGTLHIAVIFGGGFWSAIGSGPTSPTTSSGFLTTSPTGLKVWGTGTEVGGVHVVNTCGKWLAKGLPFGIGITWNWVVISFRGGVGTGTGGSGVLTKRCSKLGSRAPNVPRTGRGSDGSVNEKSRRFDGWNDEGACGDTDGVLAKRCSKVGSRVSNVRTTGRGSDGSVNENPRRFNDWNDEGVCGDTGDVRALPLRMSTSWTIDPNPEFETSLPEAR